MVKMQGEVEVIKKAVSEKDWETVRTTSHSIKGSCRNMSMNRCGEAAAELESAGKSANEHAAISGLTHLEREFPMLYSEVNRILSS